MTVIAATAKALLTASPAATADAAIADATGSTEPGPKSPAVAPFWLIMRSVITNTVFGFPIGARRRPPVHSMIGDYIAFDNIAPS